MSIDKIVEDKNKATQEKKQSDKIYKEAYKPILLTLEKRRAFVTAINERIKNSEHHEVVERGVIYTFDTEEGVKVYLQKPWTVKTLPEHYVLKKVQIRSSDFKNACFFHEVHQYISEKNFVAAQVQRKIRIRKIEDVPYYEKDAYYNHVEHFNNCDYERPKIEFSEPDDKDEKELVDLNTATFKEIDAVKHMTTPMAQAYVKIRKKQGKINWLEDLIQPENSKIIKGSHHWRRSILDKIAPYVVQTFNPEMMDKWDPIDTESHLQPESKAARADKERAKRKAKRDRDKLVEEGKSFGDEEEYFADKAKRRQDSDKLSDNLEPEDIDDILGSEIFKGVDLETLLEQDSRLKALEEKLDGKYSEGKLASDLTEEELAEKRKEAKKMLDGNFLEQSVTALRNMFNRVLGRNTELNMPKEIKEDVEFLDPDKFAEYEEDLDKTIEYLTDMETVRRMKLGRMNTIDTEDLPEYIENDIDELAETTREMANHRREAARALAGPRERSAINEMLRNFNHVSRSTFNTPDKEAEREDNRLRAEEREKRKKIRELQKSINEIDHEMEKIFEEKELEARIELDKRKALAKDETLEIGKKLLEQNPGFGKYLELDTVRAKVLESKEDLARVDREVADAKAYIRRSDANKDPEKLELSEKTIEWAKKHRKLFVDSLAKYVALQDRLEENLDNKELIDDERRNELSELADMLTKELLQLEKEESELKGELNQTYDKERKKEIRKRLKELDVEISQKAHLIEKYRKESETGEEQFKEVLDLNTAAPSQLQSFRLNGDTVNNIIDNRPYKTLNDLLKVPGIGPKTIQRLLSSTTYDIKQKWDPEEEKPDEFLTDEELEEKENQKVDVPPKIKLTNKHRFLTNQFVLEQICRDIDLNSDPLSLIHLLPNVGTDLGIKIINHRPYTDLLDLLGLIDDPRLDKKFLKKLDPLVVPKLKRDRLIDLNSASAKQIASIPHITNKIAKIILEVRPITFLDQLVGIGGLRNSQVDDINAYVVQKRSVPDVTLIDLNTDTIHKLNSLPAISRKKAQAIIENRPYEFLEDIIDVKGISDKTINDLIGLVKPQSINSVGDFGNPIDLNSARFDELIDIPFIASNTAEVIFKNLPVQFLDELKPHLSHRELLRIQPYTVQKLISLTEEEELIDLNEASSELIEELPGIGETTALLIVANRPYKYLDDLIPFLSIKKLIDIDLYTVQDFESYDTELIDLNTATLGQIASIPEMTSAKAQIIFDNTPYNFLDELIELKGISENTVKSIQNYVVQDYKDKDNSLIDLNKDPSYVLQTLPDVGKVISEKIKAARPIDYLDDLIEKKAITKDLAEKIDPLVLQIFLSDEDSNEKDKDGLIDLNKASIETLDELPNIGEKSAQKIIDIRPIKFLEELLDLPGIDLKTINSFQKKVVQKWQFIQKDNEVNLNTATLKQILSVPGIGKVKASTIFKNKPYKYLEELIGLKGITLDYLKTIEKHVVPKLKGLTDADRVDLNKATETKILGLRGVGKKTAQTIIKHRPYKELIELITKAKLSRQLVIKIKDFVLPKLENDDALRININTATAAQMLPLPGIGEKNVKNLIKHRPYKILDDLIEVDGFTLGTIKRFKDLVLPKMENENVIDLNKAKLEDLLKLPAINNYNAPLIIKLRPIEYLDDLIQIITKDIIEKIQDRVIQKWKEDSDENLVDLNSATLPQIKQITALEEHPLVAEYIYKERPYKYLDDVINVTGMTKKLLIELSEFVLPKFKKESSINLTDAQKKLILDYINKSSPTSLITDLNPKPKEGQPIKYSVINKADATRLNALKPFKTFQEFFLVDVVTKDLVLNIMYFLGITPIDDNTGDDIVADEKEKILILAFIHRSSPSDLKKIGISPELAVDLVNNKPYPNWEKLISVEGFNQGVVNLIIDYFFDGDLESEKAEIVLDFINKTTYQEWKKLPLKASVSNRILYKRPYQTLKQLLNVSGVDLELVYEIYDMLISPKLEKKVDLNKASPEELKALKGVSEKSAARIIARRPIEHLNQLIPDFGLSFTRKIEDQVKQSFLPIIDLNEDSVETISKLPEISEKIAKLIVKHRPYEYLDDLLDIDNDSIDKSFLNDIEDFVNLFFGPKDKKLRIDLNTALLTVLQSLPRITFSLANTIVNNRPIQYLDDLLEDIELPILKAINSKVVQIFKKDEKDDDEEEEEKPIIPIDLKKSSIEQIKKIPGISEKVATIIFSYKSINPQYTLDDFFYIKEVGYSRTVKMEPYVIQKFPKKVDFNALSLSELAELRPIKERSEKTEKNIAKLIDDYRLEFGYFEYLDHITKVKYVTKSLVKLLQHYVTLPLLEQEKPPKLNVYYNLNIGTAKELTENIPWLSLKEANYIVSKRPIEFLDDLLGGPFTQKKLEKLSEYVNNKFNDEDDNKQFEGTLDLNTSNLEELLQLPSINIKRAKDIIARRPIEALEDLLDEFNGKKSIFSPEILSIIYPFVIPKYTIPNVSDKLLRFLNFEFDWIMKDAPIPDDLLDEILDIRQTITITPDNIMSIFGITLKLIAELQQYLDDQDGDRIVDLNKDDKETLSEINGLEDDIIDLIIGYRPIKYLDDLEFLPGVDRELLEKIEQYVIPKFEFEYDLNKSSKKKLKKYFTSKQLEFLIFNRTYTYIDEIVDREKVNGSEKPESEKIINTQFMHELSMKPGVSLTRDFDNVSEKQFHEYEDYVSSLEDNVSHPLRKFVNDYKYQF